MQSKTSYFNISSAVIREDFRKFWAVPVLAFIVYFLEIIFFIMIQRNPAMAVGKDPDLLAEFMQNLLRGQNFGVGFNLVWVPILSVLLIFSYLHGSGTVVSVHSQPFTRSTLMNSHTLSCFLFTTLPIFAIGTILLIIAKPLYFSNYDNVKEMVNVFSRLEITHWMWESIMTTTFVMMIAIFGGMVTGTVLHHAMAALGFNAVVPVCVGLVETYFKDYFFGYYSIEWIRQIVIYASPVVGIFDSDHFSLKANVFYVVIIIALYIFTSFLYHRRKLEKATDGIVFKAVDIAITYIFGFLGMSFLGMSFEIVFDRNTGITTLGYIIGGTLGIVICRMIIMKTIRIFSKKSVIIMASYGVVAVLFFISICTINATYYSKIPNKDQIASVSFENSGSDMDHFSVLDYPTEYYQKDSVKAIMDYHRLIMNNRKVIKNWKDSEKVTATERCESFFDDGYVWGNRNITVKLSYNDKSGHSVLKRQYDVPYSILAGTKEEKALIKLKEVKDSTMIPFDGSIKTPMTVSFPYYTVGNSADRTLTQEEQKSFLNCVREDFQRRDLLKLHEGHTPARAKIKILRTWEDLGNYPKAIVSDERGYIELDFEIYDGDIASMEWLRANGYSKYMEITPDISCAAIFKPGTDCSKINLENPDKVKEAIKIVKERAELDKIFLNSYMYDDNYSLTEIDNYFTVAFLSNTDTKATGDYEHYYISHVAYLSPDKISLFQ